MAETEVTETSDIDLLTQEVAARLIANGTIPTPKKRRKKGNWESKMVWEYAQKYYLEYPKWIRVNIGALPPDKQDPIYKKTLRWADLVVRMPDHMLLVEAKMITKPSVVGQLEQYAMLLPETPMFKKWKDLPIKLKVVAALADADTKRFLDQKGIELELFQPSCFEEWYQTVIQGKRG